MFFWAINNFSNFKLFDLFFSIFVGQIFILVGGWAKSLYGCGRQIGRAPGASETKKPARTRSYDPVVTSGSAVRSQGFGHDPQAAATFQRPRRGAKLLAALALAILGSRGKRPGVLMNSWRQVIFFTILVKGFQAARPRTRSQVFPDSQ